MRPPVVTLVARSGTGKTTLLEKLIAEMKRRGYRVGAVKHDAHHFEIDHEGKDSWRLSRAGADVMLLSSPAKLAMVRQNAVGQEATLEELVARYCQDIDIVLTEGYKRRPVPKIEVHRRELGRALLCRGEARDPHLIAVAADGPLSVDVPVFDLDQPGALCDMLVERFLK